MLHKLFSSVPQPENALTKLRALGFDRDCIRVLSHRVDFLIMRQLQTVP